MAACSGSIARSFAALVTLTLSGCVFPSSDPTGIELSWRFFEANKVDGKDAIRVRSCQSAQVERVAVDITDDGDQSRQGIFRFPCDAGFQTQTQFQTEASDAFVQLNPGKYTLKVSVIDPGALPAQAEPLEKRDVEVAKRNISTEPWELTRAPVDWTVELSNADTCQTLKLTLLYDEPAVQLPELDSKDDRVIYRKALGSDLGILLDGTPNDCSADLDGAHVFKNVDRGAYVLEVVVDGFTCQIRAGISAAPPTLPVDLANLPCAG